MADKRQERAALAAKMVAEQKAKQRRATLLKVAGVIGAMAVIIAVCVVVGIKAGGDSGDAADQKLVPAGDSKYGMTVGDATAPHQVIMYEDFLCPVCQAFEQADGDQLQKLADEGKVYLDYRPFHLLSPDYSTQAANAFFVVWKESGEEVALKFHDLLYYCPNSDHTAATCNQPDEQTPSVAPNGNDSLQNLVDLAVQAGADKDDVETKILNGENDSMVTKATNEAYAAGVNGTPTVFLDGEQVQGTTVLEVAQNLLKALQ